MSENQKTAFRVALETWSRACRDAHDEPWLLYIPCKRRAFHGLLRQGEDYPEPEWKLNDLPDYVAQGAAAQGIRFVDATPALREASLKGVMTFNPIYDTHLNKEGIAWWRRFWRPPWGAAGIPRLLSAQRSRSQPTSGASS